MSSIKIAVSSKPPYKGTAWKYIKSMLTEEFQDSLIDYGHLPILKSALEKSIEKKMSGSNDANASAGMVSVSGLEEACEEEIQAYYDLISKVEKIEVWNVQINRIVMKEAGNYFSGDKSAGEVADIVEKRVGLYVGEAG